MVYLYWRRKGGLFVAGLKRFNAHSRNLSETPAAKKGSAADVKPGNGPLLNAVSVRLQDDMGAVFAS